MTTSPSHQAAVSGMTITVAHIFPSHGATPTSTAIDHAGQHQRVVCFDASGNGVLNIPNVRYAEELIERIRDLLPVLIADERGAA